MGAKGETDPTSGKNRTTAERTSERELVVTRTFNAPARIVFEAWTKPELLKLWWAPKSFGVIFLSCEADVRAGGAYRFVFGHPASEQPMAFFGRYLEVTPPSRLVWTNDEGGAGGAVTTVTFEETRRRDAGRHARPLSLEGSARRRHRLREHGWVQRNVRAIGRAARRHERARGTVIESLSCGRSERRNARRRRRALRPPARRVPEGRALKHAKLRRAQDMKVAFAPSWPGRAERTSPSSARQRNFQTAAWVTTPSRRVEVGALDFAI